MATKEVNCNKKQVGYGTIAPEEASVTDLPFSSFKTEKTTKMKKSYSFVIAFVLFLLGVAVFHRGYVGGIKAMLVGGERCCCGKKYNKDACDIEIVHTTHAGRQVNKCTTKDDYKKAHPNDPCNLHHYGYINTGNCCAPDSERGTWWVLGGCSCP